MLGALSIFLLITSCEQKRRSAWVRTGDNPGLAVQDEELSQWIAANRKAANELYEANHYLEAYKLYESLIQYAPNDGELYFKRAYCKARFGEFEQSNADYFKAINLGYKQASSYYNVAVTYLATNDSLAAFYLEKALSIDSGNTKARTLLDKVKENWKRGKRFSVATLQEF